MRHGAAPAVSKLIGVTASQVGVGNVVAIDLKTAAVTPLGDDKAADTTTDGALDPATDVIYLFSDGYVLQKFDVANHSFAGSGGMVKLDLCVGGGSCVNELHWDPTGAGRMVGVGIGLCPTETKPDGVCPAPYPDGVNTAIAVDPATGTLSTLDARFSDDCGLVVGGSAWDPDGQVLYSVFDCLGAGKQIIGLGLGPGAHHTVALSGPDTPNTIFFWNAGLYGFSDTDGLVGIAGNKTTVLVALPKGIQVATHTVAVAEDAIYCFLQDSTGGGATGRLLGINLVTNAIIVDLNTTLEDFGSAVLV